MLAADWATMASLGCNDSLGFVMSGPPPTPPNNQTQQRRGLLNLRIWKSRSAPAVCCGIWFGLLPGQSIVSLADLEGRVGELEPAQHEVLGGRPRLTGADRRRNSADPRAQPREGDPPDVLRNRLASQLAAREPAPLDQEKHGPR